MTVLKSQFGVELRQEGDSFAVVSSDEVLVTTRVRSLAEVTFDEAVAETPARQVLDRERAFFDMQRSRSESFARRASNARKSGGRGGRGGV